MSTWAVEVTVVALFAVTCGVLTLAWMRGRLGVAAIALFLVSVVVWIAAFAAIVTEYRQANNFATCDSDCGAVEYASAIGFLTPPLLIALAALAMLVSRGTRWRARRAADENRV